jgi:hypothetical protein
MAAAQRVFRGSAVLTFAAAVLAAGCEAPVRVSSAYGPGIKFDSFGSTFGWWPGPSQATGKTTTPPAEVDKLIHEIIAARLESKGYQYLESGTPDLWIDYFVHRQTRGGLRESTWSAVREEGSLVIDILDPTNGRHIWRGFAGTELDDAAPPAQRRQRFERVVRLILERFPDQGKLQ